MGRRPSDGVPDKFWNSGRRDRVSLFLGGCSELLDGKAAVAERSGDLGKIFLFYLPGVALIQPNGSMVELIGGAGAALAAAYGWRWAWEQWARKRKRVKLTHYALSRYSPPHFVVTSAINRDRHQPPSRGKPEDFKSIGLGFLRYENDRTSHIHEARWWDPGKWSFIDTTHRCFVSASLLPMIVKSTPRTRASGQLAILSQTTPMRFRQLRMIASDHLPLRMEPPESHRTRFCRSLQETIR